MILSWLIQVGGIFFPFFFRSALICMWSIDQSLICEQGSSTTLISSSSQSSAISWSLASLLSIASDLSESSCSSALDDISWSDWTGSESTVEDQAWGIVEGELRWSSEVSWCKTDWHLSMGCLVCQCAVVWFAAGLLGNFVKNVVILGIPAICFLCLHWVCLA